MKTKSLFIIFLLLLLPFTALASDGAGESGVQIIKKDGSISLDSVEKSENFSTPSNDETNALSQNATPITSNSPLVTETGMLAGQAMLENAAVNLTYSLADQFFLGGFKFASVGVEEKSITGSDKFEYSLYSTELDPFNVPVVASILTKSGMVYFGCAIILICIAYCAYVWQCTFPKTFSQVQIGIAGNESFYDFKALATSWVLAIAGPAIALAWIKCLIKGRNVLVLGLTTPMVEAAGSASDSLITYFIIRVGWYFNGLQKIIGEYGVYIIISLTFVFVGITVILSVISPLSNAVKFAAIVNIYLVLYLLMDIITLFFISFGIQIAVYRDNPSYILAAIIIAVIVDFLIFIIPTLWLFVNSKFSRISVHWVGL